MTKSCPIEITGPLRHAATVVISKTITLDERGHADCPFCKKPHVFQVGGNARGQTFYHCFGCGAGGAAKIVVMSVDERETIEAIKQRAVEILNDVQP